MKPGEFNADSLILETHVELEESREALIELGVPHQYEAMKFDTEPSLEITSQEAQLIVDGLKSRLILRKLPPYSNLRIRTMLSDFGKFGIYSSEDNEDWISRLSLRQ